MIKTRITGNGNGNAADLADSSVPFAPKARGLVTYQLPYEQLENRTVTFENPDNGTNLAVDGSVTSALTEGVYNGGDAVQWTFSAIAGSFDATDTSQANNGSASLGFESAKGNNECSIDTGSPIATASYETFDGSIYINSWPLTGTKEIEVSIYSGGALSSLVVPLSDYIDVTNTGSWQTFSIPFADLSITSANIDEVRLNWVSTGSGNAPRGYLDDLTFEGSITGNGAQTYTANPSSGEVLRVYGITYVITGTNAMTGIPASKFGHLTALSIGNIVRRIRNNETQFSSVDRDNADLASNPNNVSEFWTDGTEYRISFVNKFTVPVDLVGSLDDRYEYVVQDDLTGLDSFQVRLQGALVTQPAE